jgi:hypothetical protein
MPWIIHLPDVDVDVEDVPLSVFAEVEKQTGVSWFNAAGRPLQNASVACLLVSLVAEQRSVEAPTLTPKSVFQIVEFVEEKPEDFPTPGIEDAPTEAL